MAESPNPAAQSDKKLKPITDTKIPGTDVPDVSNAEAESERQKQWMSRVAVSTAVMAAAAAISSSFGTGHLNGAMFEQIREADQWNFYQAKGIKHAVLESRIEINQALKQDVPAADQAKLKKYEDEQVGIRADAEKNKALTADHMRRYGQLSRATTAMQIGIALAAVALLLRKNVFWGLALAAGAVGTVFLVLGFI